MLDKQAEVVYNSIKRALLPWLCCTDCPELLQGDEGTAGL